jgi:sugar phosphate isomerase/epimerase
MIKLLCFFPFLLFALSSCADRQPATETVAGPTAESFGGLALYTLRDTLPQNPRAVLQQVADLGYAYVEAAGWQDGQFYGMAPSEFQNLLDDVGLKPMSSHQGGATLENLDQMIADVKAAGFEYFVLPVPPMGAFAFDPETRKLSMTQDLETVMGNINMIADRAAAAGLKTLYHNHDFEFRADGDGVVPIEYFLEHSDPDKLNFQMDLYWVTRAGADPLDYFARYPDRWKAWHVKDMDGEGRFAPVGTGSIDFGRIWAAREQAGMEFYLVEQDMTFDGQTPLEAITVSRGGLGKMMAPESGE